MKHWLIEYWPLIKHFVINNLKIKYQDTAAGLVWSLLSPLLMVTVLYFVFYNIRGAETSFAQYLIVGILTYRFFSQATTQAMGSMEQRYSIISNLPIPRQIFVMEQTLTVTITSGLEFLILIPCVALLTGSLSYLAILVPLVHIMYTGLTYGMGLILAAVYPYFKDLSEIWAVVTQLAFFACPVMYPITMVPAAILPYYLLNPVTQMMIIYRDLILYGTLPGLMQVGYVLLFIIVLIAAASWIFGRLSRRFVEVI